MAQDKDQDTDDTFDADFQDHSTAYDEEFSEDENFEEEDWDSFDEQDESESSAPVEPKKKSKMFNIIVVAISIIGGLGFMVIQAGKNAPSVTTPPAASMVDIAQTQASQPAPTPAPPAGKDKGKAEIPATEQGFLNDKKSMEALENDMTETFAAVEAQTPATAEEGTAYANQPQEITDNAAPPMPPTMNAAEGFEAAAPSKPAPPDVPAAPSPLAPAPTAPSAQHMPQADDLLKERPADELAIKEPDTMNTAAATTAIAVNDDALNEKIDEILNRLDKMEADVNAMRESGAIQSASSEQEKIASLQATIEKMENKMETLQKTSKTGAASVTPQILGSASEKPRAPARPAKTEAHPAKEAVSWVLKGAQPGQAMVAKSGSSEMQTVVVGDSLPGVGKITGVVYRDGRWVVEGTNGRILQQ